MLTLHDTKEGTNEYYTDVMFTFPVKRYTNGFVVRLVVPVAIFMVLAGATFYVTNMEARISSATGLLIAVSALYVVMIDSIPFVGYVTEIDKYVLSMIAILCAIIFTHLVTLTLKKILYSETTDYNEFENKYHSPIGVIQSLILSCCCRVKRILKITCKSSPIFNLFSVEFSIGR